MYSTNIVQATYYHKILAAGVKYYELLKLAVKPSLYKNDNSKECLPYILNAVSKGHTVLDIGSHKRPYFFDLLKISKLPGTLVAFETNSGMYSYLHKMKRLLHLENIVIEHSSNRDYAAGATVIDFKAKINKESNDVASTETVSNYCSTSSVIPAIIKFKLERNGVHVLFGAKEILQKYKPKILIECSEGMVNREILLTAFKFLSELHYSGYFILDTIKVPLSSFDFNTYQNEVLGFYCNNFIFE